MLDLNDPKKVITVTGAGDIERTGFPIYTLMANSSFRINKLTGSQEVISGFRIPNIGAFENHHLRIMDNHVMSFDPSYGFNVIDIAKGVSIAKVPLYAGWWKYENMLYVGSIGKLLIVNSAPVYTWPNPTEQDPGASAFTIDVQTGAITPYLVTINRPQYVAETKAINAQIAAELAYKYSPEGICKERTNKYTKGMNLHQKGGGAFYGIVMGYDCEEGSYVVAYREIVDGNYQVRLKMSPVEDLDALDASGSHYSICPLCHGYPVGYKTRTESGWSEWEQKSLNIYVYRREWETRTITHKVVCKTCKGAAFH
jgi:hypothetical protein